MRGADFNRRVSSTLWHGDFMSWKCGFGDAYDLPAAHIHDAQER